jgi:hypothetical protein
MITVIACSVGAIVLVGFVMAARCVLLGVRQERTEADGEHVASRLSDYDYRADTWRPDSWHPARTGSNKP